MRKSKIKIIIICACVPVALFSLSGAAQIFECTDASGKKSFAEQCPAGTAKQRQIAKSGTSSLPESTSQTSPSYKEQEAAFQRRQVERAEADAKKNDWNVKAQIAGDCIEKRSRLEALRDVPRVAIVDPKTRERHFLSDDERKEALAKTTQWFQTHCKDTGVKLLP